MKSFKSLGVACILAMGALASCGGGEQVEGIVKNIKGGSDAEKKAIQECVENKPIALLQGVTVYTTSTYDASADAGDFLKLNSEQGGVEVDMTMYTVNIEWEVDETSPYVESVENLTETQKAVNFVFPTDKDTPFSFKIKKISCGSAVSEDPQVTYNLNLRKPVYNHDNKTIAELNKVSTNPITEKNGEYGYDLIKYDQKSPYWVGNNPGTEKDYLYVNVNGEVIYTSPDGNWGLLADGEEVMEIYAGSGTPIKAENFPALKNKNVQVSANMGHYNGNIQLGFITYIKNSKESAKKSATINYQKVDASFIDEITTVYESESGVSKKSHLQNVPGKNLSNALVEVTGKYVPGSLKDGSGNALEKIKKGSRATFKVAIDETHEVTVAYDYHTDKDGSVGLCNKLNEAITNHADANITFKGTFRYNTNDSTPFIQNFSNPGEWQVVPFLADHCAF